MAIRQNPEIKGIKVGQEEIRSGQFADDLWASLQANEKNLNELLKEIIRFGDYSGLRINAEKSVVLKLGQSEAKYYTLKRLYWSLNAEPICILGFQIHPDWEVMHNSVPNNSHPVVNDDQIQLPDNLNSGFSCPDG